MNGYVQVGGRQMRWFRSRSRAATVTAAVATVGVAVVLALTLPNGSPHRPATPPSGPSTSQPGGAAHPSGARPGRTVRRFVAAQLFRPPASFNAAAATTLARSIDMLSENTGEFDRWFPQMRAANPHLIILKYISGTTSHAGDAYPPSSYLRGPAGQLCEQRHFHNVVMNVKDTQWIASRVAAGRAPGFDGVFLDVMGISPVTKGYLSCIPTNPATGQPYTPAAWLADTTAEAASIRSALGDKVVISNGLGNGPDFFNAAAPTSRLLSTSTGALAEGWMRNSGHPATEFPPVASWLADWRMLTAGGPHAVIGMVKMWGPGTPGAVEQWHRYSLATYLLGFTSDSYYDFISANTAAANLADSPEEEVDLGAPIGPAREEPGGVWARPYARGLAVVNPSAAPIKLALANAGRTLNGSAVAGSYEIPPDTGDIITNR